MKSHFCEQASLSFNKTVFGTLK